MSPCACMGPMYGEPHCPCDMTRLGLPMNVAARNYACLQSNMQLDALFGPGGPYASLPAAPANARHLASRNRRETHYCGWNRNKRILSGDEREVSKSGHQRAGWPPSVRWGGR